MSVLAGNSYDCHTLKEQLAQLEGLTRQHLRRGAVDQGYRAHGSESTQAEMLGSRQRWGGAHACFTGLSAKPLNRLLGIWKEDGWLGRNFLKGRSV